MFDKKETIKLYSNQGSYQVNKYEGEHKAALTQIYYLIKHLSEHFEIDMIEAKFNTQHPEIFSLKMTDNGGRTVLVDGVKTHEKENARAVNFLCDMGEAKEKIPGHYGYDSSTGFTILTSKCEALLEALVLVKEQPVIMTETIRAMC